MESFLKLCYYPLLYDGSSCPNSEGCVLSNASFTVWYHKDFGLCFEYLIFSAFLGAVFGITSAFYAGLKHTKVRRKRKSVTLGIKALISLCILTALVVDLVGSFWLSTGKPYSVLLSNVILIIAWTLHLLYIWVLSRSVSHYGWGPLNLNAVWVLLFVGNILQLHTTIRWTLNPGAYKRSSLPIEQAYFSDLSEIIVYVVFGLQCLYGFTLCLKVGRATGGDVKIYRASASRGNIQWPDDANGTARHHLLSPESVSTSYGSITNNDITLDANLNACEDGANPLSLLSFWWVGPLMKRGSLGYLQKPEHLLQLPRSLKTAKLRHRFHNVRQVHLQSVPDCTQMERTRAEEAAQHGVASDSDESDDSEKLYGSLLTSNVQGDTPSASEQVRAQRKKQVSSKQSHVSLVKSLNQSFGLHYYPLGVLKLLADMLGFAGPLLLHALVSFMENATVSTYL